MYLIDTHAHIYLSEFEEDRLLLIKKADEAGVRQILMPAIDSATHDSMFKTEQAYQNCIAMIGLHPCSVNEDYKKELSIVEDYLQQRSFIAVGEIGLDFYWDKTYTKQQYEAFHKQIQLALQYDLPIAIHSRNATDECIDVITQYPLLKGVFHCFSGTVEQAQKIMATQFMLGIGGVVTFKNAGLDKVIAQTGIDKVILETDAPYLAPVPYRGKRNECSYIPIIAEKIGTILKVDIETVSKITTQNAINLFRLNEQKS